MRALVFCTFFLLFFEEGKAQVSFTFFNEEFAAVKERKAVYFTNQHFEWKGEETIVLTPMNGGQKWLATFQDGKFKTKKPYESETNTSFVKEFDFEGTLYHDKNIFREVDVPPALLGGMAVFYEFVSKNLIYPPEAAKAGIQGRVFVQFVVTAKGEVTEIRIAKGVHPLLNAEAVRMVAEIAKQETWTPGQLNGAPVSAVVIMPFLFML